MPEHIKYILFIFLMTLFPACKTDVENVNYPEFQQKLVITSFISPSDTMSYFNIASNHKLYGELNSEEAIGTLYGFISDDLNEVALDTFKTGFKINHEKMQIQYGRTYTLRISGDKGFSTLANCTVPDKMNFLLKADTFSIKDNNEWSMENRRIDVKLTLQDIPGVKNYYRIIGKGILYSTDKFTNKHYKSSEYIHFENELFTDEGMEGKEIIRETNNGINYFFNHDSAFFMVYIYNTDKSYYLFHKSMNEYNSSTNPFNEPTPVFNNVTGGLGIFAAYTIDSMIFRLK
jgi:hypothetical protein